MSKTAYSEQEVNITNCDREPIHIIGKAQEHGVIVVCDLNSFNVSQCSENIEIISIGPLVKAKPTAVPKKGAEHGVANKVAKAPVQKLPAN